MCGTVWLSTLITHIVPEIRKSRELKGTDHQSLTPFCAEFPRTLYLQYSICCPCSLFLNTCSIYCRLKPNPYYTRSFSTLLVWVCHLLLLHSWRSLSCSLTHDTLLEMATCVAAETICSRRPSTTPFLAIDLPPPVRY